MATQKLKQMSAAVILGVFASLTLLLAMAQQTALSAPLHAEPVLSVNKTSLNNWGRRIKLVFTNTVTETLLDFPTLVVLNSARISYTLTQDNGQDIRFVDPDGTLLPHEIEQWDESGTSYVWVKVPQIDAASSSDFIWLYYGNPDAVDTQQPAAVWNDDYRGVWHLNSSAYADSTTPANDGSSITAPTTVPGLIGSAQAFPDTTVLTGVHINVGSANNLDNLFTDTVASPGATLSAWINPFDFGGEGFGRILDKSVGIDA